jgi:viologen exporter family transport system permease protein
MVRRPRLRFFQMRKYFYVLRIAISDRLVYRTDFFLSTLMRFAPIVTTILLWRAIYHVSDQNGEANRFGGLTYENVVAYYLLTFISRAFSSMPGLAAGIARDVREGTIQKYLIQPIDQIHYLLMTRTAHKLVYYGVSAVPFIIVFYLCRGFFSGWPNPLMLAGGIASLVLTFFLGFYFEITIGLISFWFLEISSLLFIVMSLNYFLSGHMVPLDLLPGTLRRLLECLPFQYMAYFPAKVLLGTSDMTGEKLATGLVIQSAWVGLFVILSRVLYRRGLRRYSAFGG